MDVEPSAWVVTATVLVLVGLAGFLLGGAAAYAGRWGPIRRAMVRDPEGHRLAGSLWLGLLGFPAVALVVIEPSGRGPLDPVHWVAVASAGVFLVPMLALALNRPAVLTRWLTPRWLLAERRRLFGPSLADGRAVRQVHRPDPPTRRGRTRMR